MEINFTKVKIVDDCTNRNKKLKRWWKEKRRKKGTDKDNTESNVTVEKIEMAKKYVVKSEFQRQ